MNYAVRHTQPVIFIADDDSDDVYFVETALRDVDNDITLKHFSNGRELLKQLENINNDLPGLILLDLNMPILDGKQTLKMIRDNGRLASLPVIIFTTSNQVNEKEICIESGATSYYSKPYSYSSYLDIVRQLKTQWLDTKTA